MCRQAMVALRFLLGLPDQARWRLLAGWGKREARWWCPGWSRCWCPPWRWLRPTRCLQRCCHWWKLGWRRRRRWRPKVWLQRISSWLKYFVTLAGLLQTRLIEIKLCGGFVTFHYFYIPLSKLLRNILMTRKLIRRFCQIKRDIEMTKLGKARNLMREDWI